MTARETTLQAMLEASEQRVRELEAQLEREVKTNLEFREMLERSTEWSKRD